MKKILLFSVSLSLMAFAQAQKKQKPVTAYAITGIQKGNTTWTEVRLVNMNTGEEMQTIYSSASQPEILNARTGKPVWQHLGIGQYSPIVADSSRVYIVGSTRIYGVESRKPGS